MMDDELFSMESLSERFDFMFSKKLIKAMDINGFIEKVGSILKRYAQVTARSAAFIQKLHYTATGCQNGDRATDYKA